MNFFLLMLALVESSVGTETFLTARGFAGAAFGFGAALGLGAALGFVGGLANLPSSSRKYLILYHGLTFSN